MAVVAVVWAGLVALQPVFDLRQQGNAINAYARGMGLAHQSRWSEAVKAFDEAIVLVPDYERALFNRGEALSWLGRFDAAAADFEAALDVDDTATTTIGDLAYLRLANGRFRRGHRAQSPGAFGEPRRVVDSVRPWRSAFWPMIKSTRPWPNMRRAWRQAHRNVACRGRGRYRAQQHAVVEPG